MRRVSVRGLVVVGCCLVALVGLPAPMASAAAPIDRSTDVETIARTGELLQQRLGPTSPATGWTRPLASSPSGSPTPARRRWPGRLGANPRVVSRNAAALDAAMARLDARSANVPPSVTGWYVDVTTNSTVVSVLGSDPAAAAFAAAGGDGVRIEQVTEAPVPYWSIIGGQAITVSGARCSAGFNVRSLPGVRYVITAGHCTNLGTSWSGTGGVLGTRAGTSFPINDYGIIRVTSAAAASTALVDRYSSGSDVTVAGSTAAAVGAGCAGRARPPAGAAGPSRARTRRSTTAAATSSSGLTRTNACAEPGDSGGAFVTDPAFSRRRSRPRA